MPLEPADWRDLLPVLRETFRIWSPGLSHNGYYFYIWRQLHHPWSRKNYRFLVYRNHGEIVASMKLYALELASRGRIFSFAGIGAVYTQQAHRGQGHATRMLREAVALAKAEGRQGALLYSDIGVDFYARLGFRPLGGRQFTIYLPPPDPDNKELASLKESLANQCSNIKLAPAEPDHIALLAMHHQRWLRRQPFGFSRSLLYWRYKLDRELYLHHHSSWQWPRTELIFMDACPGAQGYVLFEHSGQTVRVLEAIGPQEIRLKLWQAIILFALERQAARIRGWEGMRPEFFRSPIITDRQWGIPMLLPLTGDVERWCDVKPCPLLELDHL